MVQVRASRLLFGLSRGGLNRAVSVELGTDLASSKWPVSSAHVAFTHEYFYINGGFNAQTKEKVRVSETLGRVFISVKILTVVGGGLPTPHGKLYGSLGTFHFCVICAWAKRLMRCAVASMSDRQTSFVGKSSLFIHQLEVTPYIEYVDSRAFVGIMHVLNCVVAAVALHRYSWGDLRESHLEYFVAGPAQKRRGRLALGARLAIQRPMFGRYTLYALQLGAQQTQTEMADRQTKEVTGFLPVVGAGLVHQILENLFVNLSLAQQVR